MCRQLLTKIGALGSLLVLAGCFANPNLTLTAAPRSPIEVSAVSVVAAAPDDAVAMGQAYAWSPLPVDSQLGYSRALAGLRERAASVGATLVVVPTLQDLQAQAQLRQRFWWPPEEVRHPFDAEIERPSEMMGLIYFRETLPLSR